MSCPAKASSSNAAASAPSQASSRTPITNGASHRENNYTAAPIKVTPPVAQPTRKEVEATFEKFAALIHASNRPLPHRYGDGRTEKEDDQTTGIRNDIAVLRKGGFLRESLQTIWMTVQNKRRGGPVDDKTMIVSFLDIYEARIMLTID
jgi:linoleate 10R-lipoxygenase